DLGLGRFDLGHCAQAPCKLRLARRCDVQFTRGALDERHAETLFEPRHLCTDRCVRHAEVTRGFAEAASLHHLDEDHDVIEIHAALCICLHITRGRTTEAPRPCLLKTT